MDDFRKYATKHLGMNSLVLDDVIKSQASYLNPYILEERQLNVTQLDVFSRLMMDRIIFLGTQVDDYTANTLQLSCFIWIRWIRARIFPSISIRRAVQYMPVWVFMIPCSSSAVMWLLSVQVWLQVWQPYCWLPVLKANAPH